MIFFAPGALEDLERIVEFNGQYDEAIALRRLRLIQSAVMILEDHPRIGHLLEGSTLRELVISEGKTGFVALYEHDPVQRVVRVVAVKHQRERRYRKQGRL